jgi:hypothetical protein
MKITVVKEREDNSKSLKNVSIESLMSQLQKPVAAVDKLREEQYNPEPDKELLGRLPHVMTAMEYAVTDGVLQPVKYTGIIVFEVDDLVDTAEAEDVKSLVQSLPQTFAAMTGATGRSVVVWVRFCLPDGSLPRQHDMAELFHVNAYRLAVRYYQPMIQQSIRLKKANLGQWMYWTSDNGLFFNPEAVPIVMKQPETMPVEIVTDFKAEKPSTALQRMAPGYDNFHASAMLFEAALRKAQEETPLNDKDSDEKRMFAMLVRLAQGCFLAGIPEEDTVQHCRYHFYDKGDEMFIRRAIHNAYTAKKGFGTLSSLSDSEILSRRMHEFMKRRYEIRFNIMRNLVEYRNRNSFNFHYKPMTRRGQASITIDAQEEGLKLWDRDVSRYLLSNRVPDYYPIEEFLAGLPSWDGVSRIREFAGRVKCDNPDWPQFFYRWFLSMMAHWRGMDKQHGNNTSPILVGVQGSRKSTFCRLIIPPELQLYYKDHINFANKDSAVLSLNRYALINIDEFDQVGASQQGFLKSILQEPEVKAKRPYGTGEEVLKRYASFIATSNHEDLLTDPTGSRRFIGIYVKEKIDVTTPVDYLQMYAEAKAALNKGERFWFNDEDEALMQKSNERFKVIPAIEELFNVYFREAANELEGVWLTAGEIATRIRDRSKMKISEKALNSFGRILKGRGVKSKRSREGTRYMVREV